MNILILGGYGNAGLAIARLLAAESTGNRIFLGGRNVARAHHAARMLGLPDTAYREADASSGESLKKGLEGIDLLVVAASCTHWADTVIKACLDAGCDYLDLQLPFPEKHQALNRRRNEIEKRNRTFITDGGFHPGLPAALIRWAAMQLETLQSAAVGSLIRSDWRSLDFSPETVTEMAEEIRHFESKIVSGRQVVRVAGNRRRNFRFSHPSVRAKCTPMWLPELAALPSLVPGLQEAGFYVSGFNRVTDNLVLPAMYLSHKLMPGQPAEKWGKLLHWSLRKFSRPPYGTQICLVATGLAGGEGQQLRLNLSHPDPYLMTAIPVVAALNQYLEHPGSRPGLWFQAHFVEPVRYVGDLVRLGLAPDQSLKRT
jgi:hypothetical protein